ncbi:hypothetical protein CCR75_002516 [Bremia lactucae]|uniref:1,3-beta-glucan synthase component FKS1-like domain-containing protein n=1 Tax=Bremia lactucae TaxID=4779 RepID=A0A976IJ32_BRELC|nr:hypothetical protein CCR75_002516 [Bremia lactucae]
MASRSDGRARTPMRRQAESNYIDVDREQALHRLESFHATASGPFELLQSKFGFQHSSVANQKENLGCWITNYQMRVRSEAPPGAAESVDYITHTALARVHGKFFRNYVAWCKFLRASPRCSLPEKGNLLRMEKEVALFLLLWGEAGNLRFMPECICFLYHNMAAKLELLDTLPTVYEGYYLTEIVRPMYLVIAQMRVATAPKGQRPFDHQDTTNYDDVNEFFWTTHCFECDEMTVAQVVAVQDPKTFKEKRSVFNPLLAFFRLWFFLFISFHVMVVITYVSYMAEGNEEGGLGFFFRIFQARQNKIRAHAFYTIFLSVSGLLAMKAVMQIWLHGVRLYKNFWMALGVYCRLFWHFLFFALFLAVAFSPDEGALFGNWSPLLPGGGTAGSYLSMGLLYTAIYCIPVLFVACLRAFVPRALWGFRLLSALDGTSRQYVGRNTRQPWANYVQYASSWSGIFIGKFLFTMQLMIRPLMAPSIEIYGIEVDDDGVLQSRRNILFILALWAPILVVFMYDTQIWFILYQSIVGLIMGKRMHLGHYMGLAQLKLGMAAAPKLFDDRVVSLRTKTPTLIPLSSAQLPPDSNELRHFDVVTLRFAIIWNQIVDNFRLNDLLDDRETVILQYRILNKGEHVEDPIFLLAGKLARAVEIASRAKTHKWNTMTLVKHIATADALEGMKNGMDLIRSIFSLLLKEDEEQDAWSIIEYIYSSPDVATLLDLSYLPQLADNIVELLALYAIIFLTSIGRGKFLAAM